MLIISAILLGLVMLWAFLAIYWLAPDIMNTAIQSYDVSDMFLSSIIIMMVAFMLLQEKQRI